MSEMQLTDADLARLELLALPYANAPAWEIEDTQNVCTRATPALVAEVRRLRAAKTISLDYMRSLHDSEQEKIAALQARVEALEWLREVELFRRFLNRRSYCRVGPCAFNELLLTLTAAREAIR